MDSFPVSFFNGLLNGGSVVGVIVLGGWMIATGRLVTRREADAKDRQIEAQMSLLATKDQTISDFRDAIATSNALTRALLDVARERSQQ